LADPQALTRLDDMPSREDIVMSNPIAQRLWNSFKPKRTQAEPPRPDLHQQAERAALYASHGYFHSSFSPLLFPFVPEIPLE
jgi:hypothetical protein